MTEAKQLKTLVVGSLISDVALCAMKIPEIHEAVEHIAGHPVWTHEISQIADLIEPLILAQFPDMNALEGEDYIAHGTRLIAKYGETIAVAKGDLERTTSPIDTLLAVAGDKPVIVLGYDPGTEDDDLHWTEF